MRRILVPLMLAALLLGPAARSAQAMPLQEAVRIGTERDPLIAALRQSVARETTNVEIARDGRRPQLRIAGDTGRTGNDVGLNITVSQVLYDWGRINSMIATASFERVKAVADLKLAVEDITLEVSELYLDLETVGRKIRQTQDYSAFARRLEEFSRNRVAGGLSDSSEIARARLEIARADERMAQLEADRMLAGQQLEYLLGRAVARPGGVAALGFTRHFSASSAVIAAVTVAPAYVQANANVGIARAGIDTARASSRPTIRLEARGRQELTGGRGRSGSIGLSAGVDLNAGSFAGRAVRAAEQDLASAEHRLRAAERELQNAVRQSVQQLQVLAATEASLGRQVEDARLVLATYEQQFVAGRRDLLDLLTTGRDLYDVQIQVIDIADQKIRTEYTAAHSIGMLGSLLLGSSRR